MPKISAICFDLDDTLWDLAPVIPRAEEALYAWYADRYPAVTAKFSREDILNLRMRFAARHPELRHDLTELRLRTLRHIARASGCPEETAADAFAVFDSARNQVELFEDVLPALAALGHHYTLYALSNGNACLERIGIADYFEGWYSARELGVAKPDTEVFHLVCQRTGLDPADVLHVGDHPENDIAAPASAGMHTAWVNRKETMWPESLGRPDYEVACLGELADLLLDNEAA